MSEICLKILLRQPMSATSAAEKARIGPAEQCAAFSLLQREFGFRISFAGDDTTGRLDKRWRGVVSRFLHAPISPGLIRQARVATFGNQVCLANSETWMWNLATARRLRLIGSNVRLVGVCFGLPEKLTARPAVTKFLIWLLQALDRVIVYSETEARELTALGLDSVSAVQFGVDLEFWRPATGIGQGEFVFSPGNDPRRDWSTLISGCKYPLVIASETFLPNRTKLPQTVRLCSGAFADMRNLYSQCRCVAVTLPESRRIAGEYTVLQAMAMEKPVIITRTEGLCGKTFRNNDNCFLCRPEDTHELSKTLKRVWTWDAHVRRVASQGRKLVEQCRNAGNYATQLAKILSS